MREVDEQGWAYAEADGGARGIAMFIAISIAMIPSIYDICHSDYSYYSHYSYYSIANIDLIAIIAIIAITVITAIIAIVAMRRRRPGRLAAAQHLREASGGDPIRVGVARGVKRMPYPLLFGVFGLGALGCLGRVLGLRVSSNRRVFV